MGSEDLDNLSRQAKQRIAEGQYSDAEYLFKKMTMLDPDNWQAWYGRGLSLKLLESYERAIYCLNQATKLQEMFPKGWYNLGFCHSQVGDIEDALYCLNKAMKQDDGMVMAMIIKAWIYQQHNAMTMAAKIIDHIKVHHLEFLEELQRKTPEHEALDTQIAMELLLN